MSTENEDQCLLAQLVETIQESPKESKILYTREFLLSLSELDICKKLPTGFDPSILSEFEDTSNSIPERPRIPGSLSSQSFRRGEYGSSPPTRGDSGNYYRGIHGRWESRSSGSNDRDADSQSDWDSDPGRRYGNQSRSSWQNPEHDGLLGSGAFPRPSGYTAGASALKVRANGQNQLNRSSEPYHPPRPYKAVPHSRRDTTDSCNDETFGSSECSSQDRSEEERKRRDSFELLRKEQQKTFQEKQKQFPDKHSENFDPDIAALLGDPEDAKKLWNKNNGSEDLAPLASHSDSAKCSFPTQPFSSRPLVPPGFTSTIVDKNLGTKSLTSHPASEVENIGLEDNIAHTKGSLVTNGTSDNQEDKKSASRVDSSEQQCEIKTVHIPFMDVSEKMVIRSSDAEVLDKSVGVVSSSYKTSNLSEAYEGEGDVEVRGFDAEKVPGHEIMGTVGQEHPTSILEKLFGNAVTVNSGVSSSFIEHNDIKADDTCSQIPFQSSKFAHWFLEEEKKPADGLSSGKPKDLLSLIVSGDKGGSQVSEMSDAKASEHIPPIFPFKNNELVHKFVTSTATSATVGICEPLYHCNNPDATSGVLTCEDLEQSILSEINESSSSLQHSVQAGSVLEAKAEQPKPEVDNLASQHLLSLLQKGTSVKDPASAPNLDVGSLDNPHVYEVGIVSTVLDNSSEGSAEKLNSEKTLTLETLFGTAFMKELHSVGAPVSVQRGSVGGATRSDVLEPHGFPFPVADGFFPSTVGEYRSNKTTLEGDILASNHMQQTKSGKTGGPWVGFDVPRTEVGSKLGAVAGFADRAAEIRLPEEESLITLGDPVNPQNSMFMPVGNATKAELFSSSNTPVDIAGKLAALKTVLKDERSMVPGLDGPTFLRSPYDSVKPEIPYQNLHDRPSSPQFPHLQMFHGRPLLQPLDSHHTHMNPQTKFMGAESIIHHESPPHHHFPADIFRPPFQHTPGGPTRFDPPAHHPMLQMHMPGNFPPPHLLQRLPRGPPLPPHPINHMDGYISELNPMQGFTSSHRQPNYGGLGMPMPAPGAGGGGSNHPEALERLIEMELRANSKQMHPVAGAAHSSATYGHEVDMGFRYR